MAASYSVREAGRSDVRGIADSLCAAFFDDPVAAFIFSSDRFRRAGLTKFFTALLAGYGYMDHGEVWTTDDYTGAAIWMPPPGKAHASLSELLKLLPVVPYALSRNSIKVLKLLAKIEASKPREEHWYLSTLGVIPGLQGHGIGSSLLRPVLEKCDDTGMPAYLESSKERNIPFYRSHGFEVVRELSVGSGTPSVWPMIRKPLS